ncbi:hypothetical protein OPV22_015195 [Ensete ventricosum]|uniref:Uncharacterized protein n=1 Tax=Ensete ventricosum TaxID=4639 RepID=A0AAV8PS39_ENSVE|nr:hypothetical protein OPV22_015195 [Ensete ventricosum]
MLLSITSSTMPRAVTAPSSSIASRALQGQVKVDDLPIARIIRIMFSDYSLFQYGICSQLPINWLLAINRIIWSGAGKCCQDIVCHWTVKKGYSDN